MAPPIVEAIDDELFARPLTGRRLWTLFALLGALGIWFWVEFFTGPKGLAFASGDWAKENVYLDLLRTAMTDGTIPWTWSAEFYFPTKNFLVNPELPLTPDALLLPLDYASSVGSRLAREATLVSDDVEQLAAVAPAKLAADYPPATGWTGDAIRQPRPAGRLVSQNLGIAATDVVLATYVADRAADRGAGTVLAR